MPTFAMKAKKKAEKEGHAEYAVDYFMAYLEKAISDCKDELIERFNWICAQSPSSATFMWENNTMKGYIPEEGLRSAMKHGTLAVGQIGLAETLQILVGENHLGKKGMELAERIEQLFKDKCNEYKEEWRFLEPSAIQIANEMVKNIKEKEGRDLSSAEINEIFKFVASKHSS